MKPKIYTIIATVFATLAGYIISYPLVFGICSTRYEFNGYTGCLDASIKSIGTPLLYLSIWILFATVIAAFSSHKIFNVWLKFLIWTLPLAVLLIVFTPVNNPSAYLDLVPFYRDDAARLAGQVFAAGSLLLILWKWFTARRAGKA